MFFIKIKEIYKNRTILNALVLKNLKGQYRNSYLGFLWQFLTPAITVVLFYVVFTSLKVNTLENYGLFLCAGIFPFNFFNTTIIGGCNCIIQNSSIVKKINIDRSLLCISYVESQFIIFLISYVMVLPILLVSEVCISIVDIGYLLILMCTSFIFGIGVVFLLSSIVVYIRDVGYLVNALSRFLIWVTPTFFTVYSLSGILSNIVWLNPLTYFVTGFQDILYYDIVPNLNNLIVCFVLALILFIVGSIIFNKLEPGFAERL